MKDEGCCEENIENIVNTDTNEIVILEIIVFDLFNVRNTKLNDI